MQLRNFWQKSSSGLIY